MKMDAYTLFPKTVDRCHQTNSPGKVIEKMLLFVKACDAEIEIVHPYGQET